MLLDAGVPVHVVAARIGDDPATLLRICAKRTKKADKSAADVIAALSAGVLGGMSWELIGSNVPLVDAMFSTRLPLNI